VPVQQEREHVQVEEAAVVRHQQDRIARRQVRQPLEPAHVHQVLRAERHPRRTDGAQPGLGDRAGAVEQRAAELERALLEGRQQLERRLVEHDVRLGVLLRQHGFRW
jgi:hypothetical protein